MMESYPDIILLRNDFVERSTCQQKLHSHILKIQEVTFSCSKYDLNSFFIQDHQGRETLRAANRTITFSQRTFAST